MTKYELCKQFLPTLEITAACDRQQEEKTENSVEECFL
jgi:hypothetical protein